MAEREVLDVDVLIVGAGPAGLACALRLRQLAAQAQVKPNILVIEKATSVGAHILSGAVLDPRALNELLPNWKLHGAPVTQPVSSEEVLYLSSTGARRVPHWLVPPYLHNAGNFIISLGELTVWLAEQARACGIEILEGVAGACLLTDGPRLLGVRCGDTGIGKDGQPQSGYQPGAEIRAKVTVLAEGVRGSLTKQLVRLLSLDRDRHPQSYALGIKEVWEVPEGTLAAGAVVHTLGFPLQSGLLNRPADSFGGGFIYGLDARHLVLGLVVGLDYRNPLLDPHVEFNRFKQHPRIRPLLAKGKPLSYGAKAIPEGGYYAMPRYYGEGFCIVGDSASFLNAARLKGVHLALKSGMLAAEAISAALHANNFSSERLGACEDLFQTSWAKEELFRFRNWRAGYAQGLLRGALHDLAQRLSAGRGLRDPLPVQADHLRLAHLTGARATEPSKPDGTITFDRVTDVFQSGTHHAEDQPCHLRVPDLQLCVERCTVEFGNPCQRFCPAAVYEWVSAGGGDKGHLQINPGNCVHCKTCDIKDPYENILWVVPEGGGGPRYQRQ